MKRPHFSARRLADRPPPRLLGVPVRVPPHLRASSPYAAAADDWARLTVAQRRAALDACGGPANPFDRAVAAGLTSPSRRRRWWHRFGVEAPHG